MSNLLKYTYRIVHREDNRFAVYRCIIGDSQELIEDFPILDVITDPDDVDGPQDLIDHIQGIVDVISEEDILEQGASFKRWTCEIEEEYYEEE